MSWRSGLLIVVACVFSFPVLSQEQEDDEDPLYLSHLVTELYKVGKYSEALPIAERALRFAEQLDDPSDPEDDSKIRYSLNDLAMLYEVIGRYADAEPLYKQALDIAERALTLDYSGMNPFLKELSVSSDKQAFAESLTNLARISERLERYAEADWLYKRSLTTLEATPYTDQLASSLNGLADLYCKQRRYADAEPLYKRSLAIRESAMGPHHPAVAQSLTKLASLYSMDGRYSEAEPLSKRALAIVEALGTDQAGNVATALSNLAGQYFAQGKWTLATRYWRRSINSFIQRSRRDPKAGTMADADKFAGLVKASHRIAVSSAESANSIASEMFEAIQWKPSVETIAAQRIVSVLVGQMAAQGRAGSHLAGLVSARQHLVREWHDKDAQLFSAREASILRPPGADTSDSMLAKATLATRLAAIDIRLGEIDRMLSNNFPNYASLATPEPLSVTDVQDRLSDREALVLFLDTVAPDETFIWVVTKTNFRWVRIDLGTEALAERVAALRCGLDRTVWSSDAARSCVELLQTQPLKTGEALPFDLVRAHDLYQALFGQVEDLIKDKHLLLVPSGPLVKLSFHVLVTGLSHDGIGDANAMQGASWLARRQPVTILPAVSYLRILSPSVKTSRAKKPLIGFGNPLLEGNPGVPRQVLAAQTAREMTRCPVQPLANLPELRESVDILRLDQNSEFVDLEHLRLQESMPETAVQLCAIAQKFGLSGDDILLGPLATEHKVKSLSETGDLSDFRSVQFSTHCAIAGADADPGLILTPPEKATSDDDGYLSSSEIARLKLDADWIILSSCNIAPRGAEGADASSTLARAFLYAGARALLVAHWNANSDASGKLVTRTLTSMLADSSIGHSEALRRSMMSVIETGKPYEAHPAYWAAFVVMGAR